MVQRYSLLHLGCADDLAVSQTTLGREGVSKGNVRKERGREGAMNVKCEFSGSVESESGGEGVNHTIIQARYDR